MAATIDTPGVIEPGKLYTAAEARSRLRAGQTTWERLLTRGLTLRKVGAKSYVLGDDVIRAVSMDMEGDDDAP